MLEFFHRYQRSIIVYIFIGVLSASMLLFGIDMFGPASTPYAIKVNNEEISYGVISERRRQFEDRLRQQFGDSYSQFLDSFGGNLESRIVDQVIEEELISQELESQGFTVDSQAIQGVVQGIFGESYSPEVYESYLQRVGMSAPQFEAQIARDATRSEFLNVLSDFSKGSKYEARYQAQLAGSTYDVSYIEIDPDKLREGLSEPSEEEQLSFYESNALRYEEPAAIEYAALVVDPKSVENTVEIFDEDIELYYAENQSEFKMPAKAKVSHIQINYGAESTPEAMLSVKERAQKVHERAVAGEDFTALVLESSDDLTTKGSGGSLGWLSEGSRNDGVETAALGLGVEGITDIVETDYGFHIVKVEEFQADQVKELKEVRDTIEAKLKKREAPAYALIQAEEYFEDWKEKSNQSLADFAKSKELEVVSTGRPLAAGENLTSELNGLTEKVIAMNSEIKQIIELGDTSVLVEVLNYKPAEIPAFQQVQTKVLEDLKNQIADEQALEKARSVIDEIQSDSESSLKSVAEAQNYELKEQTNISRSGNPDPPLTNSKLRTTLFSARSPQLLSKEPVKEDGNFYVVAVTEVKVPEESEFDRSLEEYQQEVSSSSAETLRVALVQNAKVESEIEVDPSLQQ